ncbi:MAG: CvpA family protein, partial [Gammaproteobacteria bacterium]|nr:CvpA family protein [Gammaproteobacteria bacterium]
VLNLVFRAGILGAGNRLLGAVFGFARAFILVLVIIFLVQLSSANEKPVWNKSLIVVTYQPMVTWLRSVTLSDIKIKFENTINKVNSTIKQHS